MPLAHPNSGPADSDSGMWENHVPYDGLAVLEVELEKSRDALASSGRGKSAALEAAGVSRSLLCGASVYSTNWSRAVSEASRCHNKNIYVSFMTLHHLLLVGDFIRRSCTRHSPASSGQSSCLSELTVRRLFVHGPEGEGLCNSLGRGVRAKRSSTEAQEQPDHTCTRNPETTARAMATELRDARIQGNELWLSSTVKCCAKR